MRKETPAAPFASPYKDFWKSHQRRIQRPHFILGALIIVAFPVAMFFAFRLLDTGKLRAFAWGFVGLIVGVSLWGMHWVFQLNKSVRCPRCGQKFFVSAQPMVSKKPSESTDQRAPRCAHCNLIFGAESDDDLGPTTLLRLSKSQLAIRILALPIVCLKGVVMGIALSVAMAWWKSIDPLTGLANHVDDFTSVMAFLFCSGCCCVLLLRKMPDGRLQLAKKGMATTLWAVFIGIFTVIGQLCIFVIVPIARREDTWGAWLARCEFSNMPMWLLARLLEVTAVGILTELTVAAIAEKSRPPIQSSPAS